MKMPAKFKRPTRVIHPETMNQTFFVTYEHRSIKLTPRQRVILYLICVSALNRKAVADFLGVTERTINEHLSGLRRKMHCHKTQFIFRIAKEQGWMEQYCNEIPEEVRALNQQLAQFKLKTN